MPYRLSDSGWERGEEAERLNDFVEAKKKLEEKLDSKQDSKRLNDFCSASWLDSSPLGLSSRLDEIMEGFHCKISAKHGR